MRVKRAIEALERRLGHLEETYIPRRAAAGQPNRYEQAEAAAIRMAIARLQADIEARGAEESTDG